MKGLMMTSTTNDGQSEFLPRNLEEWGRGLVLNPYLKSKVAEFYFTMAIPLEQSSRKYLRMALFEEEYQEFHTAFQHSDKVEQVDAICDMLYILHGTLLEFGSVTCLYDTKYDKEISNDIDRFITCLRLFSTGNINEEPLIRQAFSEVHRSNMSKFFVEGRDEFTVSSLYDEASNNNWCFRNPTKGVWYFEDSSGKLRKPNKYSPPDIKSIVESFNTKQLELRI